MILAIDTSSAVAVSAVLDGQVIASRAVHDPRGHVERLSPLVQEVLDEAGAIPESVVVGTGPAPFTGLRVGLVTARTLGRVWGVPVRGVCSLDALGAQWSDGEVTVVADARRKEVYWATYRDGIRQSEPQVSRPDDVPTSGAVVGRGALLYPDVFPGAQPGDPDPAWLVAVAQRALDAGQTDFPLEPLYLRRPDVHGVSAP